MPCRPTFEEIAWERMTQTERECLEVLDERWPELAATDLLVLVDMLVEAGAPLMEPTLVRRARLEAQEILKRGRALPAAWSAPNQVNADLSHLEEKLAFLRDLIARLELCLCILESQLAVWQRDGVLKTHGLADDPSVRSLLQSHLIHRRGELRAALEAAHDDARIARLRAIDDVVLCCDRTCLC